MSIYPPGWFVIKACEAKKRGLKLVPSDHYRAMVIEDRDYARLVIWARSAVDELAIFEASGGIDRLLSVRSRGFLHDGPWVADLTAHYVGLVKAIDAFDATPAEPAPPVLTLDEIEEIRLERMREYIQTTRGEKIAEATQAIEGAVEIRKP